MTNSDHPRQGSLLFPLVILFVLSFILRLIRLFDMDLNFDEAILLLIAQSSYSDIITICTQDNFSPLYPWLVKFWMSISSDPHWHRLLGALIGSLTPPMAYFLGREVYDRRLGWLLGIATSISVPLIFFSQIVRMFNIQTFWICLSLLGFIKALQKNSWRYWLLVAFANLMGFYMYVFMLFVFFAECITLLGYYKTDVRRYLRPMISQLPFFIGVLFWLVPMLHRASQVQGQFWIPQLSWIELGKVWFFSGTGSDLRDYYWLAALLNLPFLIGFILAIPTVMKVSMLRVFFAVFLLIIAIFICISISGQSFVAKSYLYFIVPIYMLFSLLGWSNQKHTLVRRAGLGVTFVVLALSLSYYYIDYYYVHYGYGYVRSLPNAEKGEGHNLSKAAEFIEGRIDDDEVIIHYSDPYLRICSYFASLYYHSRSLPEYIYSKTELAQHNGRQYLRPGERIEALEDLDPLPKGIWLLSLNDTKFFFTEAAINGDARLKWIASENLLAELGESQYTPIESIKFGKVTVIHLVQSMAELGPAPD